MRKFTIIPILLILFLLADLNAQMVMQRCDRTNLWTGSNPITADGNEKKEGIASLSFTGDGTNWFSKTFSQLYTGVNEDGYLSLWLYVSDPSKISGEGSIEISSSGGPDIDEYAWNIDDLGFVSGWNEVILPIYEATKLGNPDLNAINFFRIYQNLTAAITAKLDDIRFLEDPTPEVRGDMLDIAPLDFNTLDGKVMFGYQGWFLHPDDGSVYARWRHWGGTMSSPEELTVDMFPDFREYEADELYPSNGFTYADGRPVNVYSAYTKKTVIRHMKWVRDYGLDGVFLQRFITNTLNEGLRKSRDTVTVNIMQGCEKYGRTFANMWDLSSFTPGQMSTIINDWKHLVDDLKITQSPSYLHHRGLPLVSIWGFSVREEFPESDLQILLDFFKSESTPEKYRATVMLGVDHDFHQRSNWLDEMAQADVISPWAVGRFSDDNGHASFLNTHVLPAQDWCDQNNVDFLPVIWPGFSWANLKDDTPNKRPRRGGNFFWTQANRVISGNAKSIYIAMFDEIDESTAMYKLAENDDQTPDQGYWLALDADGYNLPSDWYLRCASLATEIVRGNINNRTTLGTPPDGIDAFAVKTIAARCGTNNGSLILYYPETSAEKSYQFSIDNGESYPYSTPAGSSERSIEELAEGVYHVWVRNTDGSFPTDLGPYTVFDTDPSAKVYSIDPSCAGEGIIHFLIDDLPYAGEIQISIDSGVSYTYTSTEGIWKDTIENLAAGTYPVWIRYADETCARELETKTLTTTIEYIEMIPMLDGTQLSDAAGDTLYCCPGSSLFMFLYPSDEELDWTITGPDNFLTNESRFQLSGSLTPEMFGTYNLRYTNTSGCDISTTFDLLVGEDCATHVDRQPISASTPVLYPNPTADYVVIDTGNPASFSCEIFSMDGRKIITRKHLYSPAKVSTYALSSGLYTVSIRCEDGIQSRILIRKD